MLRTSKKITMSGESVIGEEVAVSFSATIDFENPEKVSVGQYRRNEELYKANRAECRADFAAFEDSVYEAAAAIATE